MPRIVTLTLKIDGMVCSSCSTSIQGDLDDVENLIYGYCSLENHNAIIKYDLNITPDYNAQKFIDIIEDLGFEAELESSVEQEEIEIEKVEEPTKIRNSSASSIISQSTNQQKVELPLIEIKSENFAKNDEIEIQSSRNQTSSLSPKNNNYIDQTKNEILTCLINIEGMSCASCVALIEKNSKKLNGVVFASVALILKNGTFKYDPNLVSPEQIATKISELGFKATIENANLQNNNDLNISKISFRLSCYGRDYDLIADEIKKLLNKMIEDFTGVEDFFIEMDKARNQSVFATVCVSFNNTMIGQRKIYNQILGLQSSSFAQKNDHDDNKNNKQKPASNLNSNSVSSSDSLHEKIPYFKINIKKQSGSDLSHREKQLETINKWKEATKSSAIFGVTSMAFMIYLMWFSGLSMHQRHMAILFFPGISAENLIYFLLATPVICGGWEN